MGKRKKGEGGSTPEKKPLLATITAVVGLVGGIAVAVLNLDNIRNRFFPGPISVAASKMTCDRGELSLNLANNGRRAVAIASVNLSVLRNGTGEPNSIKVTATPETIKAGESALVKLTASSAGVGIDFPTTAGDACRLEVTFHLTSENKQSTAVTVCDCPS
jgi:hypothetical protein